MSIIIYVPVQLSAATNGLIEKLRKVMPVAFDPKETHILQLAKGIADILGALLNISATVIGSSVDGEVQYWRTVYKGFAKLTTPITKASASIYFDQEAVSVNLDVRVPSQIQCPTGYRMIDALALTPGEDMELKLNIDEALCLLRKADFPVDSRVRWSKMPRGYANYLRKYGAVL